MQLPVSDLRSLSNEPFELLRMLESQLQFARLDSAAGRAEVWTGLAFRVSGMLLVTPQRDVREVIVPPPCTRIPNARPWLVGIANVRGNLLTVVDLAQLLGLGIAFTGRPSRVLVLNSERSALGFLVDEVFGYRQFNPSDQVPAVAEETPNLGPALLGAFSRDEDTWRVTSFHRIAGSDLLKQAGW